MSVRGLFQRLNRLPERLQLAIEHVLTDRDPRGTTSDEMLYIVGRYYMSAKHYFSSVSPKGQITLPAKIRKDLAIQPRDQVMIEVQDDQITVKPVESRLLRHYQKAGKLKQPLTWQQIEEIAHEDHVLHVLHVTDDALGHDVR
jgi:AbrB family looped-hinge helix DNA binding protein